MSQHQSSDSAARISKTVMASRLAHGLVSVLFLSCIAIVYAGVWRAEAGPITIAALAALMLEGLLVLLSRGNCPLGPLFRRLGDEKPFFELLLPPRAARFTVPVLTWVTLASVVLLDVRLAGPDRVGFRACDGSTGNTPQAAATTDAPSGCLSRCRRSATKIASASAARRAAQRRSNS